MSHGERGAEEFRIVHSKGVLETNLKGVAPDEEEAKDQDDPQETEREPNPVGESQLPPALVQPGVKNVFGPWNRD